MTLRITFPTIHFYLFLLIFTPSLLSGQYWEEIINNNENTGRIVSILELDEDSFIAAGYTDTGFPERKRNGILLKLAKSGRLLSTDTLQNIVPRKIAKTQDGQIIMLATKNEKFTLLKFDPFLDLCWSKEYDEINGVGAALHELPHQEGFIITGAKLDSISSCNLFLLKVDSNGEQIWFTESISEEYEVGRKAFLMNDTIFVAGFRRINAPVRFDLALWKADSNGNFVDRQIIPQTKNFITNGIIEVNKESIYYVGSESPTTISRTFLCKVNLTGELEWVKFYESENDTAIETWENGEDIILNGKNNLVLLATNILQRRLIIYEVSLEGEEINRQICGQLHPFEAKFGNGIIAETDNLHYLIGGSIANNNFYFVRVPSDLNLNNKNIFKLADVKIYPNPASDKITITIPSDLDIKDLNYQIFSADNKLLLKDVVNEAQTEIDISQLLPSHLFVILTRNQEIIGVASIVKN